MRDYSAIVDFGSSKIVTLVGNSGVNDTLDIYGKGIISYAGFKNSEFLEPENLKYAVASSVANAEDMSQFNIDEVYVGVPGEFGTVKTKKVTLTFPKSKKISESDVTGIFRTGNVFENDSVFSVVNQSVIYYELDESSRKVIDPIGLKAKQLTGVVSYSLVTNDFISRVKKIFSEIKIKVKGFIFSPLSECLYLFDPEMRDKYAILVDVGYITTNVCVTRGNGLLFSGSFSMGGGNIVSDLSKCLRISLTDAEKLKNKVALAWEPSKDDVYSICGTDGDVMFAVKPTNEIVMERVKMICEYIKMTLSNCEYELPDFLPIYLSGGGFAGIKGIKNIMLQQLRRFVKDAVTTEFLKISPYTISEESELKMALKYGDLSNLTIIKFQK